MQNLVGPTTGSASQGRSSIVSGTKQGISASDPWPGTSEYGQQMLRVRLYSDPMMHLKVMSPLFVLLPLASHVPADQGAARQVFLLSSILLGLVVALLILLQLAAFRRRSHRRFTQSTPEPDQHPLEQAEVDPWRESARRLDPDTVNEDED